MTRSTWRSEDIPDQHGRTAVITGGNTGLGFEMARLLVDRGASVIIVCRSIDKAADAARRLQEVTRDAQISIVQMDQGSLGSVREAVDEITSSTKKIDLLINNAGMLGSRERRTSLDGHELTFATNHLGVFAFTGLLLPSLLSSEGSRVVTMSSISNARSTLDFTDLQAERT